MAITFERETLSSGKKGYDKQSLSSKHPPKDAVSHPDKMLD